ncbi:MAG: hypothetical protein M8354_13050, partial [Halalkalicoccus sp.]|nr:hypothetical protein [Halalkalicoccus sp.]
GTMSDVDPLVERAPAVADAIDAERDRRDSTLGMIASERRERGRLHVMGAHGRDGVQGRNSR